MDELPIAVPVKQARWRLRTAAVCIIALVAGVSQPGAAQEHDDVEPAPAAARQKSERTALALSLFGTLVPVGLGAWSASENASNQGADVLLLIVGGVALGPSAGHYYAGRPVYATGMAVLRGAMAESVALAVACESDCAALALLPAAIVLVSVTWDIATAPAAARAHNRRLTLAPMAAPSARLGVVGMLTF